MARFESERLAQLITRYRHLTVNEQAEKIASDLGLYIQYDTRDVIERDGISLTTRKARPHTRWVTDWKEQT